MKVLQIGPGIKESKGGMSTVIGEIQGDSALLGQFYIDSFPSYADGGKMRVLAFSALALMKFLLGGKATAYDIYHIHVASYGSTYRKMIYSKILKARHKKIILHIHGGEYMEFYSGLSPKKKTAVRNFLQSADSVIALSEDWKNKFEAAFDLENCIVVKNGVDTEKLASAITDPSLHPGAFLMLARMTQKKGTYDLLEAVEAASKEIPELKLYLAGDGEIEQVRKCVVERELENSVEVIGWADFPKKLELLNKVSTVVLPSYYEALPMCILEGMACGKAIISTTVGAISGVVKAENGILISPGDVQALTEALIKLSRDTDRVRSMAENNMRKIDEEYSMKGTHALLAEVYEEVFCR